MAPSVPRSFLATLSLVLLSACGTDARLCDGNNGGCGDTAMGTCNAGASTYASRCECKAGFQRGAAPSFACEDVPECENYAAGAGACGPHGIGCSDTDGSYRCQCESGWGPQNGTNCDSVDCGPAPAPTYGSVSTPNGTTVGQAATITCNPGFMLSGAATRTCQANGTWSGTTPSCMPVDCGALTDPVNGSVSAAVTTYPQMATYACNVGYRLSSSVARTCQTTGAWSGTAPTCVQVDCGPLTNPTSGAVMTPGTTYGQVATYACSPGYSLVGATNRTCQMDGTWSASPPTCSEIDECALASPPCVNGGNCTNAPAGSYTCVCPAQWTGMNCSIDVDECATPTRCGANVGAGSCSNSLGGFDCSCNAGFARSGSGPTLTCVDVDECALGSPCDEDLQPVNTCTNAAPGYTCACGAGFAATGTGLSASCADVDECATANGGCHAYATCTNTVGSRTCLCNSPFVGSGTSCACSTGLDECSMACFDFDADESHCGSCGNVCGGLEACVSAVCAVPRILAIEPPVAMAGQTIRLEGVFPATVSAVQFPGVTGTTAGVRLGDGRLEVTVPSAATMGALTLPGGTAGPRFRRTSFTLGLGKFRNAYEQAAYARNMPQLATARVDATAWSSRDWVYVIGGSDSVGAGTSTTERAMINADGTIGSFSAGPSLMQPRVGAATVRVGDRLYVIGGASDTSVEFATISASGTLGAFSDAGISLLAPRSEHVAVLIGNAVYVMGGASQSIERASVDATGVLGPFVPVSSSTTLGVRRRVAAAVVGRSIFLVGGTADGVNPLTNIERAPIDGAGKLGAFQAAGSLRFGRDGASVVHLGGVSDSAQQLQVVGGRDSGTGDRLTIHGTTAATSVSDSLVSPRTPRRRHASVVLGNHLYVFGGLTGTTPLATVERATIDSSAALAVGAAAPNATINRDLRFHSAVAIGRRIWMVGTAGPEGAYTDVDLRFADVGDDGTVGDFVTPSAPIPLTYNSVAVAVVDSNLWTHGGQFSNSCTSVRASRYQAIASNGDIAAVSSVDDLVTYRAYMRAFAGPDRVYLAGGFGETCTGYGARSTVLGSASFSTTGGYSDTGRSVVSGGHLRSVFLVDDVIHLVADSETQLQRATVTAGNLSPFAATASVISSSRAGATTVIVGDRVYLIGGGSTTTCESATLPIAAGAGAAGAFGSNGSCLSQSRSYASALVIDNYVYVFGGYAQPSGTYLHDAERMELQ